MKTNECYTVITGASTGLGRELAIENARRGRNLILVALKGRNLPQLAEELGRKFGIRAVAKECDLTNECALDGLATSLLEDFSINGLINNAGVGTSSLFEQTSPEFMDRIIHLNIRATVLLTRLLMPELRAHPGAMVMNISSVAAFAPLPYKSIYPASKAFIYSFSRSLMWEMRPGNVRVVVVNPGPMVTNPDVAMRLLSQGWVARLGMLTAGEVAKAAMDGAEAGRNVIVPGLMSKINRMLLRLTPERLRFMLMSRVLHNELDTGSRI